MFSCHSLPIVDRISFRCFGMSYFVCTVLPFCRYLFNLPSLASIFWFISSSCTVIFPHVACSFFPPPRLFQRLSSSFGLVFVVFFICDSSLISYPGFCCFFVLFEGIPIFSQTNFALHKLIHLTQLYYSLVCKVVCDLFYSFLF